MSDKKPLDLLAQVVFDKLEKLSSVYHYHSKRHTEDVFHAAATLAEGEELLANERDILLTAALLHDTGYLISRENHEYYSCLIAKEILPAFDYNFEEIRKICKTILATELPQQPEDQLQALLCDADLDYFGRADFPEISARLCLEMLETGQITSKREFDCKQLDFFEKHQYFSAFSRRLRAEGKEENYRQLKNNNNLDLNHE